MKPYLKFPSPEECEEEHQMTIPKSERVVPKSRTESEKVAIAIEYFSSYLVWLSKVSRDDGPLNRVRKYPSPENYGQYGKA